MKHIHISILIAFLFLSGCQKSDNNIDIANQWQTLISTSGCLLGSEDWNPGGLGEGTVLREKMWQETFDLPAHVTVPFLVGRIDSTSVTKVHNDPFQDATEGELAVYALQHILQSNWTEIKNENRIVKEAISLHAENHQVALRNILDNSEARNHLKNYFLQIYEDRK